MLATGSFTLARSRKRVAQSPRRGLSSAYLRTVRPRLGVVVPLLSPSADLTCLCLLSDILYLLHHPTPKPTGPTSDPIPVALSRSDALVLLKYIFPLQFGLHNVFTSSLPEPGAPKSANVLQDYTSRKEEIEMQKARGTQSGPGGGKRMKGSTRTRELVEELWRRHGECDYWKLRAIYCPSKVSSCARREKGRGS